MPTKLHTILAAAALAVALPAPAAVPAQPLPLYREGELLVKHRAGAGPAARQAQAGLGMLTRKTLLRGRLDHVRLPAFMTVAGARALLERHPAIEYVEPNYLRRPRAIVPNDPLFGDQWGLRNTGQANFASGGPAGIAGADLNLTEAWDADGDGAADRTGASSVIVAVIDDAFDSNHPDLAPNFEPGFNFVNDNTNVDPANAGETHGTMVAGCVGARGDDGVGVAGVAWHARILPLKFGFDAASHVEAIEFARASGARVINASFGSPLSGQSERDAIAALIDDDVLYVAAAGNDDSNTDVAELSYPANFDVDNIVAVAATNRQDNIASFSQYGARTVDVAAPGLQIVTTAFNDTWRTNPGTTGTSFASPYVAGVAALIRSHVPGVTWRDIKARLIESGTAVGGANADELTTGGRVDADRALELPPGPSLVIRAVTLSGGNGNGALDPGEAVTLDVVVRNIWQPATNVTATLVAANDVAVDPAARALGNLGADASATASFPATVTAGITGHRYVPFTLTLTADGYAATRSFVLEIGRLQNDVPVTQTFVGFNADLYDEFHAWTFDLTALPEGHNELIIETTSSAANLSSPDIDLLVKHGAPPQYSITVGTNPEAPGFFCTSGVTPDCRDPATRISGSANGTESVTYSNPAPGTYHIVIVNFAQLDVPLTYTLRAYTRATSLLPAGRPRGGGALMPGWLLGLLLAAGLRRLRHA